MVVHVLVVFTSTVHWHISGKHVWTTLMKAALNETSLCLLLIIFLCCGRSAGTMQCYLLPITCITQQTLWLWWSWALRPCLSARSCPSYGASAVRASGTPSISAALTPSPPLSRWCGSAQLHLFQFTSTLFLLLSRAKCMKKIRKKSVQISIWLNLLNKFDKN